MAIVYQKWKAKDGLLESLLPGKSQITNDFFLECPGQEVHKFIASVFLQTFQTVLQ
jgi:hypothetical protein